MSIAIPIVSILVLAGLAWLAGRALRSALCPICIGVAGTWLWMLVARFAGLPTDATMLAVLLGASAVGIAGQVESRVAQGRSPLLWKTLALPTGLVAAYGIVEARWGVAAVAAVALAVLSATFLRPPRHARADGEVVRKLEQQMKNCC